MFPSKLANLRVHPSMRLITPNPSNEVGIVDWGQCISTGTFFAKSWSVLIAQLDGDDLFWAPGNSEQQKPKSHCRAWIKPMSSSFGMIPHSLSHSIPISKYQRKIFQCPGNIKSAIYKLPFWVVILPKQDGGCVPLLSSSR